VYAQRRCRGKEEDGGGHEVVERDRGLRAGGISRRERLDDYNLTKRKTPGHPAEKEAKKRKAQQSADMGKKKGRTLGGGRGTEWVGGGGGKTNVGPVNQKGVKLPLNVPPFGEGKKATTETSR